MPAYVRKTMVEEEFSARRAPGGVIVCGHCNRNLADSTSNPTGTLYVVYVDKKHLESNMPHDVYCENCLASNFPKAKIV